MAKPDDPILSTPVFSDGPERRGPRRITCRFPAQLSLVIPEETLTPINSIVFVNDVSEEGLRILCPAGETDWPRRLKPGHFLRVGIRQGERSARLFCQVMWLSPKKRVNGQEGYELGVSYDRNDPLTLRGMDLALERAEQTSLSSVVEEDSEI